MAQAVGWALLHSLWEGAVVAAALAAVPVAVRSVRVVRPSAGRTSSSACVHTCDFRGHMYILYGPSDEIESHPPAAATSDPPQNEVVRLRRTLLKTGSMRTLEVTVAGPLNLLTCRHQAITA